MTVVNLPLDHYEALNLYEALKVVPDTGDWYLQVKWKLEGVLRLTHAYQPPPTYGGMVPNLSAEKQIEQIRLKDS